VGCSLQGALAHAKNGDEVFWKEKFHAANGKAQTCTQGALFFFLLCFGVGGGIFFFFHFSQLPNVFVYNTNRFEIETMYDYYIALKSMFLVTKLFSHPSIVYASFTIFLP